MVTKYSYQNVKTNSCRFDFQPSKLKFLQVKLAKSILMTVVGDEMSQIKCLDDT